MPRRQWGSPGWGFALRPGTSGDVISPPPPGGGPAPTPGIVTTGLELNLDASDALSYSGAGTAWDDLTTSNFDFTFASTPDWTASPGYFHFDGNQATNSDTIAITTGAFEMWFRWREGSGLAVAILAAFPSAWFSVGDSSNPPGNESMEYNAALTPTMDYLNGHTHFRDGVWYHVVAVIDGADNKLYVDGVAITPPALNFRYGSVSSGGPLWAGAASRIGTSAGSYRWDGDIAIMRLYDTGSSPAATPFSAADVTQNYNADQAKFKTFFPDSIPSLALWLDPSADETVTTVGSGITEIRDKSRTVSGARFIGDVTTASKRPTIAASGGINWMSFDIAQSQSLAGLKGGGSTTLQPTDLGFGGTGWELHIVMSPLAVTANDAAPWNNHPVFAETGGYGYIYTKNDGGVTVQSWVYSGGAAPGTDFAVTPGLKHVFGQQWNNSNELISYKDGTTPGAVLGVTLPGGTTNALHIGAGYGSNYYHGLIGEVLVFNAPLTSGQRTSLMTYLSAKWGTP